MTSRIIGTIGLAVCLALSAGDAAVAKRAHHRAPPPPAPYDASGPRMIEIRPGLWISTWDCVTDEGQGRFRPCNGGAKGD
jgi:hypothetical protein